MGISRINDYGFLNSSNILFFIFYFFFKNEKGKIRILKTKWGKSTN